MSDSESLYKNVILDDDIMFGEFANAFRVVDEVGPDCFLDFVVYSATEEAAQVVSRVRIRKEFVAGIRKTLKDAMAKFSKEEAGTEETEFSAHIRKNGEPIH